MATKKVLTEPGLSRLVELINSKFAEKTEVPKKTSDITNDSGFITAASPELTGVPTAPTAASGTDTTQIATTAFVQGAVAGKADASSVYTKAEVDSALTGKADTATTLNGYGIADAYTKTEIDTTLASIVSNGTVNRATADGLGNNIAETYATKAELSAIPQFDIQVVNALPEEDISDTTVYLVLSNSGAAGNLYTEYIHVNDSWEKLGEYSTNIDLSDYMPLSGGTLTGNIYTTPYYDATIKSPEGGQTLIVSKGISTKGTLPAENEWHTMVMAVDNTGSTNNLHKYGQMETAVYADGKTESYLQVYKNEADSTTGAKIVIGYDANGNVYTAAPTPAAADNSTKIATTAFVKNAITSGSANGTISVSGSNVAVKGLKSGAYADEYVHPTSAGNKHIPSGGSSEDILVYSADGTAAWGTVAPTANALNNYYSSRQTSANTVFGDGKLRAYVASSKMTTGKPPSDASMLHIAWDNTGKYDGQIAVSTSGSKMYVRSGGGKDEWDSWRTVLFSDSTLDATKLSGAIPSSCNSGVRSIATGSSNGTISVNTNGTAADVAVKGLGSAAYTASTAYAAASHGNHVPATQTANNAKFLRNDNTWQTVTPANIGAAATYSLSGTNTTTDWTVFASATDAGSGNKAATLMLTQAGNFGNGIQGAWFIQMSTRDGVTMKVITLLANGSGSIEFGYYSANSIYYFGIKTGNYRGSSIVTILGNEGFTLSKISNVRSAPSGWTAVTPISMLSSDSSLNAAKLTGTVPAGCYTHTHSYLPLSGGTLTGNLLFGNSGTTTRQLCFQIGDNDYARIAGGATASNAGWMEIATADDANEPIYVRQYSGAYTTIKRTATLLDASGNTTFPGNLTLNGTNGTNFIQLPSGIKLY